MKQKVRIIYKAVFKTDGQSDDVNIDKIGTFEKSDMYHIVFDDMEISYNDHELYLVNGSSKLHMIKDRKTVNDYQLDYGYISLKVQLLKLIIKDNYVGISYHLYDHDRLITKAYITINMISLEKDIDT